MATESKLSDDVTTFRTFEPENMDYTHLMALIFGCSGSGKSFLIRDLLTHINRKKYWKHVILMSPTENLTHTLGVTHEENTFNFLDLEYIDNQIETRKKAKMKGAVLPPMLFILDDCAADPLLRSKKKSPLDRLFISGRHFNMGCIILLQNMNALDSVGPALRNNATLLAITRPRKCKDRQFIVREWFSMGTEKEGEEALLKLTEKPYTFAIADLHQFAGARKLNDFIYQYKAKPQKEFKMGSNKVPTTVRHYRRFRRKKLDTEKNISNSETSDTDLDTDSSMSDGERNNLLTSKVHKNAIKKGVRGRIETSRWGNGDEFTFFTPFNTVYEKRKKRRRIVKL